MKLPYEDTACVSLSLLAAGRGKHREAAALLGLRIDTLLRYLSRDQRAYHKPRYLENVLGRSRRDVSRAVSWLADQGVERADGTKGKWSIALPDTPDELRARYVMVSAAALFRLDRDFDFSNLAKLHNYAEGLLDDQGAAPDKRRNRILPLHYAIPFRRSFVLAQLSRLDACLRSPSNEEAIFAAAVPRDQRVELSLQRLQKAGHIDFDGQILLTPARAKEAWLRGLNGADVWDLLRHSAGATPANYARLRGDAAKPAVERSSTRRAV